jgi:hypothetical protein
MMSFFTKLLTPIFIALGMVNPTPVIETPMQETSLQQEIVGLRQKVQDLESQINPEAEKEIKVGIVETKPVEAKKDRIRIIPVDQPMGKVDIQTVVVPEQNFQGNSMEKQIPSAEVLEKYDNEVLKIMIKETSLFISKLDEDKDSLFPIIASDYFNNHTIKLANDDLNNLENLKNYYSTYLKCIEIEKDIVMEFINILKTKDQELISLQYEIFLKQENKCNDYFDDGGALLKEKYLNSGNILRLNLYDY